MQTINRSVPVNGKDVDLRKNLVVLARCEQCSYPSQLGFEYANTQGENGRQGLYFWRTATAAANSFPFTGGAASMAHTVAGRHLRYKVRRPNRGGHTGCPRRCLVSSITSI